MYSVSVIDSLSIAQFCKTRAHIGFHLNRNHAFTLHLSQFKAEWRIHWYSALAKSQVKYLLWRLIHIQIQMQILENISIKKYIYENVYIWMCVSLWECVHVYLIFALIEFRTCTVVSLELKVSLALRQHYLWFCHNDKPLLAHMTSLQKLFGPTVRRFCYVLFGFAIHLAGLTKRYKKAK